MDGCDVVDGMESGPPVLAPPNEHVDSSGVSISVQYTGAAARNAALGEKDVNESGTQQIKDVAIELKDDKCSEVSLGNSKNYEFSPSKVRRLINMDKETIGLALQVLFWFTMIHSLLSITIFCPSIIEDPLRVGQKTWIIYTVCTMFVFAMSMLAWHYGTSLYSIASLIFIIVDAFELALITLMTLRRVEGCNWLYFLDWILFTCLSVPLIYFSRITSEMLKYTGKFHSFINFTIVVVLYCFSSVPITFYNVFAGTLTAFWFHLFIGLIPLAISIIFITIECIAM